MKNIFTLFAIIIISFTTSQAQLVVPDFTLTDINGNSYNLYTELANGKTIVLDFFALQCGSCQTGIAYAESVWQNYGNNGSDLWVWAIEITQGNPIDIQDFVQVNGGTFPGFSIADNDTLYSFFNITYTPQYFVICPNGYIKSCAVEQIDNYVESCPELNSISDVGYRQSTIQSISTQNSLKISFTNFSTSLLAFELFDILGNKISQTSDFYPQGNNSITMNKSGLPRGYYFVRMSEAGKYVCTKKFVLP